jgi:hypothetical protein
VEMDIWWIGKQASGQAETQKMELDQGPFEE